MSPRSPDPLGGGGRCARSRRPVGVGGGRVFALRGRCGADRDAGRVRRHRPRRARLRAIGGSCCARAGRPSSSIRGPFSSASRRIGVSVRWRACAGLVYGTWSCRRTRGRTSAWSVPTAGCCAGSSVLRGARRRGAWPRAARSSSGSCSWSTMADGHLAVERSGGRESACRDGGRGARRDGSDRGATFRFTLMGGSGRSASGAAGLPFAITGNQLVTTGSLDYGAASAYSLQIGVSDQWGGGGEEVLTIAVTDVSDTPSPGGPPPGGAAPPQGPPADAPPTAVDDAATVRRTRRRARSMCWPTTPIRRRPQDDQLGRRTPPTAPSTITGGGTGLTYQPNADYCNDPPGTALDTFTYTLNGGSTATVTRDGDLRRRRPARGPGRLGDGGRGLRRRRRSTCSPTTPTRTAARRRRSTR